MAPPLGLLPLAVETPSSRRGLELPLSVRGSNGCNLSSYFQHVDVWAFYPSRVPGQVRVCVEFVEDWCAQTGLNDD
jgi:hypothetical protein